MNDILLNFKDGHGQFSFEIKLSENRWVDKDTGYLYCDNAIFGHTGVQEYYASEIEMDTGLDANQIIKVHRFPDDVFTDEVMASYEGKTVTREHPKEQVNKTNNRIYDVGTILKVWRDGENIRGKIVIKDMETIEDIVDGKMTALSLGYRAKLERLANGEFKQTDIHINHLAIVKQGRAKNARIMDSKPKERNIMNLFGWLKGQKVRPNDDGTITIMDGDTVEDEKTEIEDTKYTTKTSTIIDETETYDDETGESSSTRTVTENRDRSVEEEEKDKDKAEDLQDEQKNENEEEENKEVMDEKMIKELQDSLAQVKAELKSFKEEQRTAFDDVNPVNTGNDIEDQDKEVKYTLDFERDEKLRKTFWDLYTNPTSHGSFSEFNSFRKKANKNISV